MNRARSVIGNVPAAMDLIVTKAGGLKTRIENVQCMAIEAQLDSTESATTQARTTGLYALRHIVRELEVFADEIGALVTELLETLRKP